MADLCLSLAHVFVVLVDNTHSPVLYQKRPHTSQTTTIRALVLLHERLRAGMRLKSVQGPNRCIRAGRSCFNKVDP